MGNLVITNKGRELMAELIAGTSTGTFTRVCTSACGCSGMELEELTGLPDIKQEAAVSKVSRIDTAQVEVLAAINNSALEEGYYVRGIGLYASGPDGEEILYGISVESEHPDYMPAFGGRTVSGITYRLNVKVDNSEQVTVEVNPAAVSTVKQVEAVQAAVEIHTEETVCSEDGVHGFRFYNNLPQVYREESKTWIDTNAASGNTARTVTKAIYQERLAAYQKDSTYKDPDSGLPFADTLYYVEDDYQDMERQAENIRYTDTCALGSANLQGIIDIIAEKVKTQLLSRSDVADNLLSTATDLPLSANQGSILNSRIDGLYNIYPRIIITAADGLDVSQAVITASDGSHAYTGRFAGQECVITIMEVGTYTLSSTEYVLDTASVEITALMQRVEVGISNRVYLYKEGDECISLTGGWTGTGSSVSGWSSTPKAPEVAKKAASMLASLTNGSYCGALSTLNMVNTERYKKVCIDISAKISNAYASIAFWLGNNTSLENGENLKSIATTADGNASTTLSRIILAVPIDGLNGEYYPGFKFTSGYGEINLYAFWLE